MPQTSDVISSSLAQRSVRLTAGCDVDCAAVERWNVDLPTLRRLAEGYRAGWLHNVMGRITPLTLRQRDDYLAMADFFIDTEEAVRRLLDKFQTDIELFCQLAGITVTEHMTGDTVSDELKAHVSLYKDIAQLVSAKFDMPYQDPIQAIATAPLDDMCNPFIVEFMDDRFPTRKVTS